MTTEDSLFSKTAMERQFYHVSCPLSRCIQIIFPGSFLMELYGYQPEKKSQNPMLIPCLIQVKREFDLTCCQQVPHLALCSASDSYHRQFYLSEEPEV